MADKRDIQSIPGLTIASIKMYFRNFTAVFFTFVFPVIFLLVFGFISSNDSLSLSVGYVNNSNTELSQQFDDVLVSNFVIDENATDDENTGKIFAIDPAITTEEEAVASLSESNLNAAIIVDEAFGLAANGASQGTVRVLIDDTNPTFGDVATSIVGDILDGFNVEANTAINGQPPVQPFAVVSEGVQSDDLDAISYLVPGIIGFSILSLGVFSITEGFIQLKTNGSLRRLKVAPISPASFLVAQSLTRVLMTIINVATMLILAIVLFDFEMKGDIFSFMAIATLGIVTFLGMGYAIAGWAKDGNQAAPLTNIIFFPMMFLSGTFFPRETFPDWLVPVTDFMPLTYVADSLRDIAVNGTTFFDQGTQILGIFVWTVIIYTIAIRLFRWE